jgi:preprotein translocase subunit Sec63
VTLPWALAGALVVLLYLRSPIDLLPDRLGPLGLVDDVVVLVLAIWWLRRRRRRASLPPAAAREPARWDPYTVLGVDPGATRDEIAQAYRDQMKRYHPDRVADLGDDLRRLAHEKTVEIQRAYAELGGRD